MAVEDAAALAEALDHATSKLHVHSVLKAFEAVRRKRSTQMQEASFINGILWHFEDGPNQRKRDAGMKFEVEGEPFTESPNQWSDPTTQAWAYGYDAEDAVRSYLELQYMEEL